MAVAAKRSIMTLYSGATDIYSHQARIVMVEKGVTYDTIDVKPEEHIEEVHSLNPYGTLPILIDRDLVLYKARIIMEYLDERFPHPPLLPVYPVARAKARIMMLRIQRDWYSLYHKIIENGPEAEQARKDLQDSIVSVAPVFGDSPFFMNDEFSLMDCCLVPLLWRLPKLSIELPKQAKPIEDYAHRMFKRKTFKASLTEAEKELR